MCKTRKNVNTVSAEFYCPVRYDFVEILQIFTFTSKFQALEVIKMITRQSSAGQNRGRMCKTRKNVNTVSAEF